MVVADRGSQGPWNGLEEFQLDFDTMADICQTQHFTIDDMATRLNTICKKYFSKAAEVEAAGHDFFAQEWGVEEHLWVNPPPHLFAHVIWKLIEQEAHGAAVFHLNTAFTYYSVFVSRGHLPRLVTLWKVVQPVFSGESRQFMGAQLFDSLVFGFDCSVSNPLATNLYRSHCLQHGCGSCIN